MHTKSLLIGITSFISGALLVSIAATTFDKAHLCESSRSVTALVKNIPGLQS